VTEVVIGLDKKLIGLPLEFAPHYDAVRRRQKDLHYFGAYTG